MNRPIRMGDRSPWSVSASVLLSRVLGLGREALIAALIGVNTESDLYYDAFLIPDFLNYLLAGRISHHHLGSNPRSTPRIGRQGRCLIGFHLGLSICGRGNVGPDGDHVDFRPHPGRHRLPRRSPDPSRLASLTRIVLPAQIFLVLGALFMAVQYTHKRFLIPAFAPVIYNLGIIAGGLVGTAMGEPSPESFLIGAVAGAAAGNFGLQWVGARRTGTWFLAGVKRGAVREYLLLALPLMLGQSVAVLDEQFVRLFGQLEEGATSALFFARRLNMVPIGVIAQAAGVAAFPFLAGLAAAGKTEELIATTTRAARKTIFIAAGATALLLVLARPTVRLLYQYREFTADDSRLVADLLSIYAFSIPAWGLHQLLSRHFYAKRRMWLPVGIGTVFAIIAIPTWLGLYRIWDIRGFAVASVIVMIGYSLTLLVAWGYDSGWPAVKELFPSFWKGMVAAGLAGVIGVPIVDAMGGSADLTVLGALGVGLVGLLVSAGIFATVSLFLKSRELTELTRRG